jgi:enterobacterial common antigen flippase
MRMCSAKTDNLIGGASASSALATTLPDSRQETLAPKSRENTYGQILKSSALIAGSSTINIGIGIARTKAMAMLLDPSGLGLMGLYTAVSDLTQSIAGVGINSSGVRQIADATGSGDTVPVARTAAVLKRTAIFLGLLGAVFLVGFATPVAMLTFGNDHFANGVAVLSLVVFFNIISAGQSALIQGLRRISELAKISVLGAFFGTIIGIVTVYYLREDGIVPALVLISLMTLLTSWWYRRKLAIPPISIPSYQVSKEQAALLKLGFAFMSSGLMMVGAAYVVRLMIVRVLGMEAAGLYQSAWTLGGLYVGFVLQAMGTDFYPRLVPIVADNAECSRVVNEQAHVSLLLAGPGILATLTFAPVVIELFYTPKFAEAVEILRWLCLGMALRVISWPMGYIIIAKGWQAVLIGSELAWTLVYLGLAWPLINMFGLKGIGIAFFCSYIFHVLMIYLIVWYGNGFRWSPVNAKLSLLSIALIGSVFLGLANLSPMGGLAAGIVATALYCIYSIQAILRLISEQSVPRPVRKILRLLKLMPLNQTLQVG